MKWFNNLKLSGKFALPIIGGGLVILLVLTVMILHFKNQNIEMVCLNTAETIANQVKTLRAFHTKQVVPRAKESGMKINYDLANRRDTLPLPATFVHTLGKQIAEEYPGIVVRLYSRFPFPHRTQAETALNQFENDALNTIEKNPRTEFYRLEEYKGQCTMQLQT